MKDLPLGLASFEEIRLEGNVYADKTEFLRKLLKSRKPYFLSRPRRFGKTLLVSTLEAILRGRRELFQGLWIDSSDYDWTAYPVIHLSMDSIYSDDPEEVKKELRHALDTIVSHESFSPDCLELLKSSPSPGTYLASLIQELHLKHGLKPAVLIDEYDSPIIRHLDQPEGADQIRKIFQQFYSALKHAEKDRGFTFITGVTKFTKASIFSALNNLVDLTLKRDYSQICGFTLEEFDALFQDHLVETLAYLKNEADWAADWTIEDLKREILAWYDGYSWDGETRVLNPWSVLNFFDSNSFSNYWYNSGNPNYIISVLKRKNFVLKYFSGENFINERINAIDLNEFSPLPVLFQAGYLTVKETRYEGKSKSYCLSSPNLEVTVSLCAKFLTFQKIDELDLDTLKLRAEPVGAAFQQNDALALEEAFHQFLSFLPVKLHSPSEGFYQTCLFFALALAGQPPKVEEPTGDGFIDAVLEVGDQKAGGKNIFIIELKYVPLTDLSGSQTGEVGTKPKKIDKSQNAARIKAILENKAQEALAQIEEKNYASKYLGLGHKVFKTALIVGERTEVKAIIEEIDSESSFEGSLGVIGDHR
ncbi:MAG: ATP-binding protein [Deltaproteobacteria bacterium]|jgi:hypothetical protein|nr:ATP-binding protein [Deltaproteobacteria bacterium]